MPTKKFPPIGFVLVIAALFLARCAAPATLPAVETNPPPASPPASATPAETPVPPSPTLEPSPLPLEPGAEPPADWRLVVIGDSSLWGLGEAFASQIEKDLGLEVALDDFALPSLSAGAVLNVLQTGDSPNFRLQKLPDALKDADVVVMFVNPMDSVDPEKPLNLDGCFGCSAPVSCAPDAFDKYISDLKAIWTEIFELRAGQPTILRATDLYNPVVSRWNECQTYDSCTTCWEALSAAVRQSAEAVNVPFLSRYDAFNGLQHNEDPRENGYIRPDGEHPTGLASQFTAGLLSNMGYAPVPPP